MADKNIINLVVGPIATNCWIYPLDDGTAAIIDPGDEAEEIIAALKNHKLPNGQQLTPKYILLTHGHFDHICAVPQLAAAFPGIIQIAIHSKDSAYLGPDAYNVHKNSIKSAMGNSSFLDMFWADMPPADILLEEGSSVGPFTVIHLPGHTQGSIAFWDKENGMLFTGDTLFARGIGRTDLPGGDENKIFESLRRLFAMEPNIVVYPGHGRTTTIGQEKR
ncbi:MAG: MBL fold metallo-hydrolase [Treponema sp.]|nr:MBL fold metallo-hydrolase [Treponema sp.]